MWFIISDMYNSMLTLVGYSSRHELKVFYQHRTILKGYKATCSYDILRNTKYDKHVYCNKKIHLLYVYVSIMHSWMVFQVSWHSEVRRLRFDGSSQFCIPPWPVQSPSKCWFKKSEGRQSECLLHWKSSVCIPWKSLISCYNKYVCHFALSMAL